MKLVYPLLALFSLATRLDAQVQLQAHTASQPLILSRATLPRTFHADAAALRGVLRWEMLRRGLELSEFTVEAGKLGVDLRVIVVRIDPALFEFSLVQQTRTNRMTGTWNVDVAPAHAVLALNAGQFKETGPWGWLVLDGRERRDPGFGPLSVGIAFDSAGCLRWIPFAQLTRARADRSIRSAFQSYPILLLDGRVPALALDVDQHHRDARLLLAQQHDGKLLIVLTRYDGLGRAAARVPIGLTLPESIVLIGELGAQHAVMLDGGVSAQMLVRDQYGATRAWKGMRDVPLALMATPR